MNEQQEHPVQKQTTPEPGWRQRAIAILDEQAKGLAAAATVATLRAASAPVAPSGIEQVQ